MKSLLIVTGLLMSIAAHADKVQPPAAKTPGVNENITIGYDNGLWRSTEIIQGAPTAIVSKIIPVSQDAFKVLSALDKSAKYQCVIVSSTMEQQGKDPYWDQITKTYYVLDINCN